MVGWNPSYNWTHEDFKRVISQTFDVEKQNSICLDTEHSDYKNEQDIVAWANELGYGAEVLNSGDSIRVYKK